MQDTAPVTRGTRVEYHGSIEDCHGTMYVLGECDCMDCCRDMFLGRTSRLGVRYRLAEFSDATRADLSHVRRTSFTLG